MMRKQIAQSRLTQPFYFAVVSPDTPETSSTPREPALRRELGLTRRTAIVGAVGSTYTLGKGLSAGGMGLAR
jgi:hypothetical protein